MLTGHWMLYGRPFLSLEGNGTGVMEGEAFTWAQQGNVLVITTASGMTERVGFSLVGDVLTVSMGGEMQLTRAPGSAAAPSAPAARESWASLDSGRGGWGSDPSQAPHPARGGAGTPSPAPAGEGRGEGQSSPGAGLLAQLLQGSGTGTPGASGAVQQLLGALGGAGGAAALQQLLGSAGPSLPGAAGATGAGAALQQLLGAAGPSLPGAAGATGAGAVLQQLLGAAGPSLPSAAGATGAGAALQQLLAAAGPSLPGAAGSTGAGALQQLLGAVGGAGAAGGAAALLQQLTGANTNTNAPQPGATNDELSQLLTSSNWCWLRYANGNSYTQKLHFAPDGTWRDFSENDIYSRNVHMGSTAHLTGNHQNGGQWRVQNGTLHMSSNETGGQLVPVPLRVTRNSNGYPIIHVGDREYSMCR